MRKREKKAQHFENASKNDRTHVDTNATFNELDAIALCSLLGESDATLAPLCCLLAKSDKKRKSTCSKCDRD